MPKITKSIATGSGKGDLFAILKAFHDTQAEIITLLTEVKADFNLLRTDFVDLRTKYEAHRVLTAGGVHGGADSTNAAAAAGSTVIAAAVPTARTTV